MTTWSESMSGAGPFTFYLVTTQSLSGTKCTVTSKIQWKRSSYGYSAWNGAATWSITIDGTKYTGTYDFNAPAGGSISTKTIATKTKTITLTKGASAKTITVKGTFSTGTSSAGSGSLSKSYGLPRVPYDAPSKPTGLSCTPVSNSQINIDWNLSSGKVTQYQIDYRKKGTSSWSTTYDDVPLRYLSGLATATEYEFRIRAQNSDRNSAWSGSVFSTTKAVAPSVPRSMALSSPAAGQFKVTFSAPSSNGGKGITQYDMQYRKGTSGSWTYVSDISSGYVRGSLTPGDAYQVQVRARNTDEVGPWCSAESVTTKANAPGKTPKPTLVIQSDGSVKVTWSAPSSNGGKSISNYDVAYQVPSTASTVTKSNVGTSRSYVLPKKPGPGDRVNVQVRAKNVDATGAWSDQAFIIAKGSGEKAWDGSSFTDGTNKVWNGSAWVDPTYKVWSGTAWVDAN